MTAPTKAASLGEIRANLDTTAQQLIKAARTGQAATVLPQARDLLARYPTHIGIIQGMLEVCTALGDLPGATVQAEKMVQLMPNQAMTHVMLATTHIKAYKHALARESLKKAEALAQNEPLALAMVAHQYEQADFHEDALRAFTRLDMIQPNNAQHLQRIAAVYRFLGKFDEAEDYCNRSIANNPDDWHVYFIRSDLRKQTKERNHVQQLEGLITKGIPDARKRGRIMYALVKEYEDLGEADNSFRRLKEASDLQRQEMDYNVKLDLQTMQEIKTYFDKPFFQKAKPGFPAQGPIFVIGMPRTGTTLVEHIIGSHSKVRSMGELNIFPRMMVRLVKEMVGSREVPTADRVKLTSQIDYKRVGELYMEGVAERRRTGEPFFIDKLPYNYLNIGPIHAALPNAKIIQLDRHPMDTCYAIYKTLFGQAYPFSYTMEELGAYYAGYRKLMDHWHDVLPPGRILKVRYEDVVEDQEGETRKIFKYCGLDWEDQVREFYKNDQVSTTASASQVRQPVYKSSVAKWRKYEKHLEPLKRVLQANGIGGLD